MLLLRNIVDFIFGYDLFISYSRAGWGEGYAAKLSAALSRPPFEFKCFVDVKTMETGRSWKVQGRRALQRSSKVILLLTPGALRSPGVLDELKFNQSLGARRKPITLIDIRNTWEKEARWNTKFTALLSAGESATTLIRIDEGRDDSPSKAVLDRIQLDFKIRSENAKRAYVLLLVACVLLVLAIASSVLAEVARQQRSVALDRLRLAEVSQSRLAAALSDDRRSRNQPVTAQLLALQGLPSQTWSPERPVVNEAVNSLLLARRVFTNPQTILYRPLTGSIDRGFEQARFDFDDRAIVTQDSTGHIEFWKTSTGALIGRTERRYDQLIELYRMHDNRFDRRALPGEEQERRVDAWPR